VKALSSNPSTAKNKNKTKPSLFIKIHETGINLKNICKNKMLLWLRKKDKEEKNFLTKIQVDQM
jgi:hypothetical protein